MKRRHLNIQLNLIFSKGVPYKFFTDVTDHISSYIDKFRRRLVTCTVAVSHKSQFVKYVYLFYMIVRILKYLFLTLTTKQI